MSNGASRNGQDLAIDLKHVAKTYRRKVRALRGIEMKVQRGEIFGLLGPNGAGKSTLVKILMTVIRASKCSGSLLGHHVGHKDTLAKVGYLPEHHKFPDYLKGRQVLDFYAAMSGVPRPERKRKAGELLELVGISKWAGHAVGGYSKGMRQRLGIAQALMNSPDLVLLDEPTDGVDPVGRRDIRDILFHLREEGRTVFLNSHLLSELELVCDRVAILVQGVVRSQGTLDELTLGKRRYEIEIEAESEASKAALRIATAAAHETNPELHASTLRLMTTDPHAIQPVLNALRGAGIVIRAVRPYRPSLDDLFMEAVTDPTTGKTLEPGATDRVPAGGAA